ncbi:TetR/AcrR family transcriptional regulator [Sutcliffiella horikoshii]|uniref:TetR/AcrR family transcriptional regulator n=1 Tax=Sutcliffiella horikoshii TaxID=79883 RepID=UPI0007D049D4|nr:TetR/AcrR family transcriptional regulator [Sutcliffiella horikoshii]MCM3617048.1 TetR/AcrR family transcriptional regulator [Sutcliffiella horikoshii]
MSISTSEQIKQSALQLFAQKGYFGTSLNDVATKVGIKKPSLYAHFKNKDDLYLSILHELMDTFKESVSIDSSIMEQYSTKDLLYLFLKNMVDFWKDETMGLLYKRTLLFPEEHFRSTIQEQFLQTEAHTTAILREIMEKGKRKQEISNQPIEPLIDSFYCLVDGLFVQRFFYPLPQYDMKVEHAFTHFWKAAETGGE